LSAAPQELDVDQLARQARAGCSASFEELTRRVSPGLLSYLRGRCPTLQDAEDLRQETLLRVHRNLARYDPQRPFEPWLLTIAARLAAGRTRGDRRTDALPMETVAAESTEPSDLDRREAGAVLWATASQALSGPQYRALRLRYVDGLDVRNVAAAMGVTIASAKVLLFRARRRLMDLPSIRALLDEKPQTGEDCHGL